MFNHRPIFYIQLNCLLELPLMQSSFGWRREGRIVCHLSILIPYNIANGLVVLVVPFDAIQKVVNTPYTQYNRVLDDKRLMSW